MAGPVLFRRQLPPQMLLVDHLLRISLFPLQHYVQCRGAILEALYRISEGFWFSPSELVMTALLHFEDKVHHKGLVRAEGLPLLMTRLLSQVLEHVGFPEEPRIERRISCTQVLSMERSLTMPISFVLQQQDQEEVPDEVAEDPQRGEDLVPEAEVEVERSSVPDSSPPSPPLLHQPLLTLPALHTQRSSLRSLFMSVRGSLLLLWMLSARLLPHKCRWTSGWPEPRPL